MSAITRPVERVAVHAGKVELLAGMERALAAAGLETVVANDFEHLDELCDDVGVAVVAWRRDDLRRPGRLEGLRREHPHLGLVIVSTGDTRHVVRDAMAVGAEGYVCETQVGQHLAHTVRAVLAGCVCLPRTMRREVVRVAFTRREREVLLLVWRGQSNQEIARRLFLSESTIKSHLASAFRKLGVTSRVEAAALLSDPDELERVTGSSGHYLAQMPDERRFVRDEAEPVLSIA